MPKVVNHDARRADIAEAVWRVIVRAGINGATIREIADEAGCSTGVLAHYFTSKESLLLFALNYASSRTGERMRKKASKLSGLKALRAVLLEALPLDGTRREEWRIWISFWGTAVGNTPLSAEQSDRYKSLRKVIAQLLQSCIDLGEIDQPENLEQQASSLLAMIDGLGIQAFFEPRRMTPGVQRKILNDVLDQL